MASPARRRRGRPGRSPRIPAGSRPSRSATGWLADATPEQGRQSRRRLPQPPARPRPRPWPTGPGPGPAPRRPPSPPTAPPATPCSTTPPTRPAATGRSPTPPSRPASSRSRGATRATTAWFHVRVAIEQFVTRQRRRGRQADPPERRPGQLLRGTSPAALTTPARPRSTCSPATVYGFRMSGGHFDTDRRLIGALTLTS